MDASWHRHTTRRHYIGSKWNFERNYAADPAPRRSTHTRIRTLRRGNQDKKKAKKKKQRKTFESILLGKFGKFFAHQSKILKVFFFFRPKSSIEFMRTISYRSEKLFHRKRNIRFIGDDVQIHHAKNKTEKSKQTRIGKQKNSIE